MFDIQAKYCASEMPGEYYECSRSEYCCGIGCCVSPGLHFHHLWYYWILVIIMFLVCSGGGWWYRYWLQGRYRAAASAIPARSSNARAPNALRGSATCQGQRARITYNSARNTVLLHRMWKGPQRNGTVPAYNAIGNATTSAQYQNMSVMLNDANCPYYQLYGPPPSYETVIAQTRGKPSSPASPESTNARTNAQSPSIAPTSSYVPQCFSYTCNFSARLNDSLDHAARFASGGTGSQPREPREAIPFTHFPPYCAVTDGTVTQTCLPFVYQEPFVPRNGFDRAYRATPASYVPCPMEKSSEAPEASSANAERYTTVNVDCVAGSSGEQVVWRLNDCSNESTAHGGQSGEKNRMVSEATAAAGVPSLFKLEGQSHGSDSKSDLNSTEDSFSESTINRRVYGGSLKVTGRYAGKERCEEYSVQRPFSKLLPYSCDGLINTEPATARAVVDESRVASSLEDRANVSVNSFQSNPSNNVISACSVSDYASSSTGNVERLEQSRSRLANASTNSNLESKRRLDRSKSLD
ncbi:uncharacterized protein LOC108627932 isoform X7 [Ceratina calcarata]|uniref:WW domain binding protein VOPP1 n=1 Tax=Ceratina calcarata TaxID=156304 RepID=A0AAJ7J570_9HYME|nr:uncharacterized protein LOC108627932 isoform X7 [Ceratina calcarata]